jgi:endogenous inhibitor of DNA gyrase (YacG/DUF329 family)
MDHEWFRHRDGQDVVRCLAHRGSLTSPALLLRRMSPYVLRAARASDVLDRGVMLEQRRSCAVCGRDLLWSQRRDARFCSARCRQRNFRLARQEAGVLRDQGDDHWIELRSQMPAMWKSSDLATIEFPSPVPCFHCRVQGTERIWLFYRASTHAASGVPAVYAAVFCSEDCLLDAVHDRRFASS